MDNLSITTRSVFITLLRTNILGILLYLPRITSHISFTICIWLPLWALLIIRRNGSSPEKTISHLLLMGHSKITSRFLNHFLDPLPVCHILSHIRRPPIKNYVTLTYTPSPRCYRLDYIPNIESEVKILPNIIRIIRYSCNIKYCCHSVIR